MITTQRAQHGLLLMTAVGLALILGWQGSADNAPVWIYLSLWVTSVAFAAIALIPVDVFGVWLNEIWISIQKQRREWLFVVVVTVFGLGIRLVGLDSFPNVLIDDEAVFGVQAAQIVSVQNWQQSQPVSV